MTGWASLRRAAATVLILPALAGRVLRAWITLDPHDWSRVADVWRTVAALFPDRSGVRLLEARLLRSARRFSEAEAAGKAALVLAPGRAGVLLEYARALRGAGKREAAIAHYVAAWHHGERAAATRELCRYGARAALPEPEPGIVALAGYASFAADNPAPPAPAVARTILFRIVIIGAGAGQAATRASLSAQLHAHWLYGGAETDQSTGETFELQLTSGTKLDPQALAWLAWAIEETDCRAVVADYDLLGEDGVHRTRPVFLCTNDRLWSPTLDGAVRIVAGKAGGTGPIAHLPLILASCPAEAALLRRNEVREATPRSTISVIIPTRDNADLLSAAIATLGATASAPARIELVIVDNGSRTIAAKNLLSELAAQPRVTIVPFDAEFNWSRANRLGSAAATGDVLVFLNDDTEMQTSGWDRILGELLADPGIGAVGARMLYPDGTIQHAGFVFGMDNGPQHEGRWMSADDAGPGERWLATRQAAAVTGAFMAMRRVVHDALGGFDDATFAVDFADVDFCLRLRERGLAVAYCGGITLLHHESASRGLNLSRAKRRRMRREAAALRRRWGEAVDDDPGYQPAWSRTGCSYDGIRALSSAEVVEHVRKHTGRDRWRISRKDASNVQPLSLNGIDQEPCEVLSDMCADTREGPITPPK